MAKTCSACKIEKNELEFHKNSKTKSGFDNLCKECRLEANRKYKNRKKYAINNIPKDLLR